MNLDRTTYEAWLLDRIEGRLTPEQERQLEAFLAADPDIRTELDELPVVDDARITFDAKELLKKNYPPTGEPDASRLNDFLVAHVEGDLTKEQEQMLDRFLYEHPDAQRDARMMMASKARLDEIRFDDKPSIERHFPPQGLPDKHRLTDFLIAAHEGDLASEQRAALDRYVDEHPDAQREQRLITMTRVQPERIVFIGKEQLKKREVRVVTLWPRLAAAASVALLIGVAWWLLRDKPTGAVEVARNVQQLQPAVRVPQGPEPPSLERFGGQRPETLKENVPKTPGESGAHMSTPSMSHDKERNENNGQKPATPQQNVAPGSLLPPPEPQLAHTPAVVQPVPDALVPPNDNEPSLVQQNTPDQEAMKAQEAAGSNVSTLAGPAARRRGR